MKSINPKQGRRIKFFTLGCKANQYDTQSIRERFVNKGFKEIQSHKPQGDGLASASQSHKPDFFLINTCTVTSGADQKSRNIIRRCIQSNPKAKIIVTGCLVENDYQSLAAIQGIDLVIKKSFFPEGISKFSQHTRAFLKIQDGCSNFCSYCKVALVRGKERSKELKPIVDEAKKLVACGYKEIVLTGICLGAYGRDLSAKSDLVDVIKALEKIKGLSRIRLSSIEAGDVSLKLINHLKASKKLCRHLHIPIQSGDDKILKKMNRKYTNKKYQALISRIKRKVKGVAITTDCLLGFPTETDNNFKNTVNLVKKIMPLKTHIFPYSVRPGTKAAGFSGLIDPKIIKDRCKRLENIANICRKKFMQKFIAKKTSVLIEGSVKGDLNFLEGLTDNYLKVKLPYKLGLKNKIVQVKLKRIIKDNFIAEFIDNF